MHLSALDDDSLTGPVPSMGRITGSASIETLVRVGIEKENGLGPESKMVVLHDFTPCKLIQGLSNCCYLITAAQFYRFEKS